MNQNGWELRDFMVIIGVIFFSLIVAIIAYKNTVQPLFSEGKIKKESLKEEATSENTYQKLEHIIKVAAERYQNNNYSGNIDSVETKVLTYKFLKEKKYIKEKLIYGNEECSGYVIFDKDRASIKYKPFIKCKNYKTKGYEKEKDE